MRRSRERHYKELRRQRRQRMRKRFGIGIGALIGAGYIAVAVYFSFHFYRGTVLYGGDCSNMTAAQAKEVVARQLKDFVFQIEERGGQTEEMTAEQMGIVFRDDGEVNRMLRAQHAYFWPVTMLLEKKDGFSTAFSYDRERTRAALEALDCMDENIASAPQDAYIMASGTEFIVAQEEQGNLLDREKAVQAVFAALDEGKMGISFEESDCYQKPQIYQDDETLNRDAEAMNEIVGADIVYDFGDREEHVDAAQIREWLVKEADGSYTLDENLVADYVKSLASTYDTFGLGREFYTSLGYTVSLFGGDYGWLMDQEATLQALLEAVRSKFVGRMEPEYIYTAMSRDTNDIGDTYVEVCISQQRMWCYENGNLIVDTPVVTGNPNTGHGTPSGGVWAIDSKMREYTLRGEDYAAPVDYWMAFNGDVGLHDLESRSVFGGDIYLYGGSHGCVNTPYYEVQTIYNTVSIGTPVVVYE